MRDDVALQSQQFAEGVYQRRDQALNNQANAVSQFDPVGSFYRGRQMAMQQQSAQLDMAMAQSSLETDELRRQQAIEELMIAREIHSTDMLDAQKRVSIAEAENRIAKLERDTQTINSGAQPIDDPRWLHPGVMYAAQARGFDYNVVNGRLSLTHNPDPERMAQGKRDLVAYFAMRYRRSSGAGSSAVIQARSRHLQSLQSQREKLLSGLTWAKGQNKAELEAQIADLDRQIAEAKMELDQSIGGQGGQPMQTAPAMLPETAGGGPEEDDGFDEAIERALEQLEGLRGRF